MKSSEVATKLGVIGVVPVIVLEDPAAANPLADALVAGGMPVMEITLRSDAGLASIEIASKRTDVLVGAGTVLNQRAAEQAIAAGAKFIVSPGLDEQTVRYCQECNVLIVPGVCTASEVQKAINLGLEYVKFFPAQAFGGAATIKALAGPFPQVRFVPTGGITLDLLASYLAIPAVHAVGGSWMVAKNLISSGDFAAITNLASQAVDLVKSLRR